ncbi:hypothetical protein NL676_021501 [Syzygium grande]|nr:hypothetical protein NL676_021501 [Syzygium grande]
MSLFSRIPFSTKSHLLKFFIAFALCFDIISVNVLCVVGGGELEWVVVGAGRTVARSSLRGGPMAVALFARRVLHRRGVGRPGPWEAEASKGAK